MKYSNGKSLKIGDAVTLDIKYEGIIKAVIEEGLFSEEYPKEEWEYLKKGILIDTDFGGLVQYQERDIHDEPIEFKCREKDL